MKRQRQEEEEITRCVCSDDLGGKMICCEECEVWQHMSCMNIKSEPKVYYCEECRPRNHPYYDLFKGRKSQNKKRATMNSQSTEYDDITTIESNTPSENSSSSTLVEIPLTKKEMKRRIEVMKSFFERHNYTAYDDDPWETRNDTLDGAPNRGSKIYSAILRLEKQF